MKEWKKDMAERKTFEEDDKRRIEEDK